MRYIILFMILWLHVDKLFAQQILKQYDFNEGGYYICLTEGPIGKSIEMISFCPDMDGYTDSTSLFYTSDVNILNNLKKEIVLYKEPSKDGIRSIYTCGYPYYFCVYKDGNLLLKIPANIECGYMATSMGQLIYNSTTLKQHSKGFKPIMIKMMCFKSNEERVQFIEQIKNNPDYLSYKLIGQQPILNYFSLQVVQLK